VFDQNDIDAMPVYIDGADEINQQGAMIKGGGGALTREKIVASVADRFVCIADGSKLVDVLGTFPLPVEVIPMAAQSVSKYLSAMGAMPMLRMKDGQPYITDNACYIIDAGGMQITEPSVMESKINDIPGVVSVGLFAIRGASVCLLGTSTGVRRLEFQ
jgi:ribose 5-phosphate isomerase A